MKGTFITIEGVEGVGKSTVAKIIAKFLTENNKEVILTREPGGTILAESIREMVLHNEKEYIFPETELLLFFAARKQHCKNIIFPSLEKGNWVICDRFVDASYAYQGGGRGIATKWINMLTEFLEIPKPDLTILLDVSEENVQKRMKSRTSKDRIEKEEQSFFARTKKAYLDLAKSYPEQYVVIDANSSLETVKKRTEEILLEYI